MLCALGAVCTDLKESDEEFEELVHQNLLLVKRPGKGATLFLDGSSFDGGGAVVTKSRKKLDRRGDA